MSLVSHGEPYVNLCNVLVNTGIYQQHCHPVVQTRHPAIDLRLPIASRLPFYPWPKVHNCLCLQMEDAGRFIGDKWADGCIIEYL